jgi:hypothetical protein
VQGFWDLILALGTKVGVFISKTLDTQIACVHSCIVRNITSNMIWDLGKFWAS